MIVKTVYIYTATHDYALLRPHPKSNVSLCLSAILHNFVILYLHLNLCGQ